ncbi:MAG: hypothetical protein AAB971_01715 [Patescibacteria group bacterium]
MLERIPTRVIATGLVLAAGGLGVTGCGKASPEEVAQKKARSHAKAVERRNALIHEKAMGRQRYQAHRLERKRDIQECRDMSKPVIRELGKNVVAINYPPEHVYLGSWDGCGVKDPSEEGIDYIRKLRLTCIGSALSARTIDYLPESHTKTRPAKDTFEEGYGDGDDLQGNVTVYDRHDVTTSVNSVMIVKHSFCRNGQVTKIEAGNY